MHARFAIFATTALFIGLSSLLGTAAEKSYLPVAPTELLALLPKAPDGWKVTTSMGANDPGHHPILGTFVQRAYRFDPPPPPPGEPALLPMITEFTLLDTAFERERFLFLERPPAKAVSVTGPAEKRYTVGGVPVIEREQGATRLIMAGFSPRFILVAKLTNQDNKQIGEWLRLLNFPEILAAADKAPKVELPPKILTVNYVDELKPETNRTSQMFYETDEEKLQQSEAFFKSHQSPLPPPNK